MSHTPTTPTGAPTTFDPRTAAILDRLQGHIPLVPRPFAAVASDLALTEDEVFRCIREQRARGVIRQVSAIFDTRSLGYQSSLVAACYPEDALDAAAAVINRHPGVSHNYRRDHEFNLWYTIAVPPGRSLDADVEALHRVSGALSSRLLPTLRTYKIGVRFRLGSAPGRADDSVVSRGHRARSEAPAPLDEAAIRAVRALQLDLAAVERPFDEPAARHGFASAEELLQAGEALRANGALRRLSAVLHHRQAGYAANGMVVWRATPQQCDAAGPVMASNPAVSHCYQRPAYPDWPYTLFTMIHGQEREEVEAVTRELQEATGLTDYRIIYSTHEYKKVRVRYFDERLDAWDPGSAGPSTPHPAGDR
jgi:DNA-binding Lrp family transcriptional regulator